MTYNRRTRAQHRIGTRSDKVGTRFKSLILFVLDTLWSCRFFFRTSTTNDSLHKNWAIVNFLLRLEIPRVLSLSLRKGSKLKEIEFLVNLQSNRLLAHKI